MTISKAASSPRAQGTFGRGGRKIVIAKWVMEFAIGLCLLAILEAPPIKSHQSEASNVSLTKRTPMSMSNCMLKAHNVPALHEELQAREESWEQEKWSSSE